MKTKSLLFLLACWCALNLKAQNIIVFQQTQQQTVLVNQSYTNYTGNDLTRQLIQTLATEMQRSVNQVEIPIFFSYEMRIMQVDFNLYNYYMQGKNLNPTTDVMLNGFKMNDFIVPDLFTFDIQVLWPNGTVKTQTRYTNVMPNASGNFLNMNLNEPLPLTGAQMRLVNLRIGHSQNALNNFIKRMQLIRNYKNTNLSYYINALKLGSWNNIDSVEALQKIYNQANVVYNESMDANLQQLNADPEGKLQQQGELKYMLDMYGTQLNYLTQQAPALFYKKGLDYIKMSNLTLAEGALVKSNNINKDGFLPAKLQMARVFAGTNRQDTATQILINFASTIPDSIKPDMNTVAGNLIRFYEAGTQKNIAQKLYAAALDKSTKAEKLCGLYTVVGCNAIISKIKFDAANASFNQNMKESNDALSKNNFQLAEDKVNAAQKIASENSAYLTTGAAQANVLLTKIKQTQYDQLIMAGKINLGDNKVDQAYDIFKQAKSIQQSNKGVKPSAELGRLTKAVGKDVDARKLRVLLANLGNLKLAEAQSQFKDILNDINFNGLQNEAEIKSMVGELYRKLGSKECAEAQEAIVVMESKANECKAKHTYHEAMVYYDSIFAKYKKYPTCNFDTTKIAIERTQIIPAVQYEDLLANAANQVDKTNYNKAVELLDQAVAFYQSKNLTSIGVPELNREEWTLANTKDAFFRYQMADHYYKLKDASASLRLLKAAIESGMGYKLTKDIQVKTGIALAKKDHASKGNSPQVWVMSYIAGNEKKFKYFKKAYLKQWKTMEKK